MATNECRRLFRRCVGCERTLPVLSERELEEALNVPYYSMRPDFTYKNRLLKDYVAWQSSPYEVEINNDHRKMWLCEQCSYDHSQDI